MHPQRESGKCVRELDVTVRRGLRTPNAAGSGLLSHAVGTVTNALREIVAARDEVLLCGVGLAIIGGIIWLLLLRLLPPSLCGVLITTAVALLAASALCALRGGVVDEDMLTSAAAHAADAFDNVQLDGDAAAGVGLAPRLR